MSIPTPKVCAPQAKNAPPTIPISAAALLAGAAKKGKASSHLVYVGEAGCEAAAPLLLADGQPQGQEGGLRRPGTPRCDGPRPGRGTGCGELRLAVRGRAVLDPDQGVHRDELSTPVRDRRRPEPGRRAADRGPGCQVTRIKQFIYVSGKRPLPFTSLGGEHAHTPLVPARACSRAGEHPVPAAGRLGDGSPRSTASASSSTAASP